MRQKLPTSICPSCQAVLNGATCIEDDNIKPKPNDFSICIKCGQVLSFDQSMHLQMVPTAMLQAIEQQDPPLFEELWQASMLVVKSRMMIE